MTDRHTETEGDRQRETERDRQTNRQRERHRQTDIQTDRGGIIDFKIKRSYELYLSISLSSN